MFSSDPTMMEDGGQDCHFNHDIFKGKMASDSKIFAKYILSRVIRKPTTWFLSRPDTKRAIQTLKMNRGLKFWIYKVQETSIRVAKTKAIVSSAVAKLVYAFVIYMNCWFSHDAAHLLSFK